MKRILCVVCLTLTLSFFPVPVYAQGRFIRGVLQGILINIGSAAAEAFLERLSSSSTNEDTTTNQTTNTDETRSVYTDGEFLVLFEQDEGDLKYYGVNLETEDSIILSEVISQISNEQIVLAWYNGDYRYQTSFSPDNLEVIRLQVFDGFGNEILNRILTKLDLSTLSY